VLFVLFLVHIYVSWAVRMIYVVDYGISKANFLFFFFFFFFFFFSKTGVYQSFTIFVVGFYWGANIAYIILSNAKADYGENTATILLVVSVVVGLLVGGLLCCCFFLAVYLLGGFFGFIIAMWILSWSTNGLIQTNWGRAILIVCLVIAGMVLIAFLEKPVFIIGTAFIGSFVIFLGVDIYVKSGLLEMVDQMIHARSLNMLVTATPQLRGLLGGIAGLTVVGSLIQWCLHRGRDYRRWNERYTRHDGYGWRRV
jgi:hypothetical protein